MGILSLILLAAPATAHPLDMGYLKVETGETIAVSFDLDVTVAAQLLRVDATAADARLIAARATELAVATYRGTTPTVGAEPCRWGTASGQLRGRNVTIEERLTCPPGVASWELTFVKKLASTFQVLARVRTGTREQIVTLDKNALKLEFGTAAASTPSFGGAVWDGVVHGGPTIDHVVFVLALLLAGGTLGRLVGMAGAFGAMHVVGATLADNGVAIPATLQAAVPALAIAIAVATLIGKPDPGRMVAAIAAGALHGLASAPASASAGVGFSLGLAVVQLAIVIAVAPALAMVPAEQIKRYVPAAAAVVALAAAALFVRSVV